MTYAQKHGSTDMETVIFRRLKSKGLIIAVWPYVSTGGGNVRYQYLFGTNSVETSGCPYNWLMKNSVAATESEYFELNDTLQLMGYWFSVDTRRNPHHWSLGADTIARNTLK